MGRQLGSEQSKTQSALLSDAARTNVATRDADAAVEAFRADDIRQTVSVALAYYEDTLAQSPAALYYIGPGTASEFASLLGDGLLAPREPVSAPISVRELLPSSQAETARVPRALLAPVAGALLNG